MPHRTRATNEIYKQIGRRIRVTRATRRMTQKQLADALGITFQQLQKYETAKDRIPLDRLLEVAAVQNVPLDRLLPPGDDNVNSKDDPLSLLDGAEAVRMVKAFKMVCPKYRRLLLEMVELCALRMYPSCDE